MDNFNYYLYNPYNPDINIPIILPEFPNGFDPIEPVNPDDDYWDDEDNEDDYWDGDNEEDYPRKDDDNNYPEPMPLYPRF